MSCVPTRNDSLLSPHDRQDITHCFEHLVHGLPHHDGCHLELQTKQSLSTVCGVEGFRIFYQKEKTREGGSTYIAILCF